jgi:hypothetical protein
MMAAACHPRPKHTSLEFKEEKLRAVATRKHRRAFSTTAWQAESESGVRGGSEPPRVLVCLGSCGYILNFFLFEFVFVVWGGAGE